MNKKTKALIPALLAVAIAVSMGIFIPQMTKEDLTLRILASDNSEIAVITSDGYDGEYSAFCEKVQSQVTEILGEDAEGTYTVESTFVKNAFDSCKNAYEQTGARINSFAQVVTTTDGQILSIFSSGATNENYALTKTQPYSSFKPLSVYAPALENGKITWASSFTDSPVKQIADEDGKLSDWPANATGEYRNTDVSLDECLKYSLNTAAVRCLMQSGVADSVSFVEEKFGIDVNSEKEQMSLKGEEEILHNIALGYLTAGVSPVDMAGFYQIFATGGKYTEPYAVKTIRDENGNVIYEHKSETKQIISEETAYIMNLLLQNTLTQGGTAEKAFVEGIKTGGKTGTGSNYSGNWFIGYTPEYVCSIWHGQNQKNICTETYSHLRRGLEHDSTKDFPSCPTVTLKVYCKDSGGMLSLNCNSMATGYFPSGCVLDKCKIH